MFAFGIKMWRTIINISNDICSTSIVQKRLPVELHYFWLLRYGIKFYNSNSTPLLLRIKRIFGYIQWRVAMRIIIYTIFVYTILTKTLWFWKVECWRSDLARLILNGSDDRNAYSKKDDFLLLNSKVCSLEIGSKIIYF